MTENDKALLHEAQRMHCYDWMNGDSLVCFAESDETRKLLNEMTKYKYQQDIW